MKNIVILISGRGSNLRAILEAVKNRGWDAHVAMVICNRPDVAGLQIAQSYGIPTQVLRHDAHSGRSAFDAKLMESIDSCQPDLVILAGFMRLLTDDFVEHYDGKLLNIHPSLLPSFPGLNTHAQALAKGVKWHGATVHFVSKDMDQGPIIAQGVVPVLPDDTPDRLSQRVLEIEHLIYVAAIEWFLEGRIRLENGIVSLVPPAQQFFANFDK